MDNMIWKRDGAGWRLFHGRHIVGRVVPDAKYTGMWRVKLPGGLSDLTNLTRARDAARELAIRKIEHRRNAAEMERKAKQNQGALLASASLMHQNGQGLSDIGRDGNRIEEAGK